MPLLAHKKKLFLLSAGLFFLLVISIAFGFGYYLITPPGKGGHPKVFQVREGVTLKAVARDLEAKGFIRSRVLFELWGRFKGYGSDIKTGEYLLSTSMPPSKIFNILMRGKSILYSVTIPEGYDRRHIAAVLAEENLVDERKFLALTGDPQLAEEYGFSGPGLEGFLFPDTYEFSRGLAARAVIDVMVKRFRQAVAPLSARIRRCGMSLEEVVTLASIVEKETGRSEERPLIASVFLNRLKKKMRLESDPTVIYGLKSFTGNLRRKDLEHPSPYNTYLNRGLPPGPIASPGLESIKAVLFPARTDYLYFVSKNDGTHHFSKTLEEHNRAVRIYQKRHHS
ncbi:MAG: endolytic transglycosylase MltG [Desulfatiglandaceae bacterium]